MIKMKNKKYDLTDTKFNNSILNNKNLKKIIIDDLTFVFFEDDVLMFKSNNLINFMNKNDPVFKSQNVSLTAQQYLEIFTINEDQKLITLPNDIKTSDDFFNWIHEN